MALTLSTSDPAWGALVADDPAATPFHHPAWAETLASAYGFTARGLVLELPDGGMAAIPVMALRRRRVSLPFTDACPPLVGSSKQPAALGDALEALRRTERLASIEIRSGLTADPGFRVPAGYRHELRLAAGYETTASGFSKSKVMRKLRRAEREGVTVRRSATTRSLLEDFYPLHIATRRRLGVPVQPRRFFSDLGERLLEAGLGFILTAEVDGRPISSAVFLAWNRRLIYKFSASERSHGDVGASQAVVSEAVRWGCENDFVSLDFGRTDLGSEGLRAFKRSWGATEHELTYTFFADRRPRTGSGRAHDLLASVLRRSPESLTRAVGNAAYRYTA